MLGFLLVMAAGKEEFLPQKAQKIDLKLAPWKNGKEWGSTREAFVIPVQPWEEGGGAILVLKLGLRLFEMAPPEKNGGVWTLEETEQTKKKHKIQFKRKEQRNLFLSKKNRKYFCLSSSPYVQPGEGFDLRRWHSA